MVEQEWVKVRSGTFPVYEHARRASGGLRVLRMRDAHWGGNRFYLASPDGARDVGRDGGYLSEEGARAAAIELVAADG